MLNRIRSPRTCGYALLVLLGRSGLVSISSESWNGLLVKPSASESGSSGVFPSAVGFPRDWRAAIAVLLTGFFHFCLFPPLSLAEAGWFFLIPVLLVDWSKRSRRSVFFWGWIGGFAGWLPTLFWLRHVTLTGTIALSAILAVFFALWLSLWGRRMRRPGGWWVPLGAAGLWVVFEWVRTWLFWGFPWNPVAVSQWNRPAMLSFLPVTGAWGLSFLLVWINVSIARWVGVPFTSWKRKGVLPFTRKIPLNLVVPVGVMVVGAGWYFWTSLQREVSEPVRIGFVQPYSKMKWDLDALSENMRSLWDETRAAAAGDPDLILWPESATPYPILGNEGMRRGVELLAREVGDPILMGNMAFYEEERVYENGVFLVVPESGVEEVYYAKRELVPFGEFIPFRETLPFLEKVVPIELDCRAGERAVLFPFPGGTRVGPLVCYEEVFPALARDTVRAGADWLFVATNNAWYGEGAGAYQHATHSVLRAVETRRPVLRSGNGGWSGWIDAWGHVRHVVTDEEGSIYFKGQDVVPVDRDLRFAGVQTPYVRLGDWFVWVSAVWVLWGEWSARRSFRRGW